MTITATMVKELREASGAGMMDAKKALTETDGDMEAAIDWLRTKGLAKAAKKSGRTAADGLVGVAVKGGVGVAGRGQLRDRLRRAATRTSRRSCARSPKSRPAATTSSSSAARRSATRPSRRR